MVFGLRKRGMLIDERLAHETRPPSPEKRLLTAVLMDALKEFREIAGSHHPDDDGRRRKLRAWFFANDVKWPFSFVNVCEQLDLNPDSIRARLAVLASDRTIRPPLSKRRLR